MPRKHPTSIQTRGAFRLLNQILKSLLGRCFLVVFTVYLCILFSPVLAIQPGDNLMSNSVNTLSVADNLIEQGKKLYERGRFTEAVKVLQQAVDRLRISEDKLGEAIALSNLSLAYQELGLWAEAQKTVAKSLNLLGYSKGGNYLIKNAQILAQIFDVQGKLQFSRGQTEAALMAWQKAADIYTQDSALNPAFTRNRINSAIALQTLGRFRQANEILTEIEKTLKKQPSSSLVTLGLRNLGNVLQVVGNLKKSQQVLEQSLALAKAAGSKQDISEALFSLGNTARAQHNAKAANYYYQQAIASAIDPMSRIQAQLNQLSLLIESHQYQPALTLSSQIQADIDRLPPTRRTIYAKINFAQSLMKWKVGTPSSSSPYSLLLLANAIKQAQNLEDKQAESYALGSLGELYEKNLQFSDAQKLTEKALFIAQGMNASDITYQWQWQLGRLLKQQGKIEGAIAYYNEAFKTLQSLRSDLVAINPDIQFSFKESVEPVYRELVELLLQSPIDAAPNLANLKQARFIIESLQIAELDNFFRSACLETKVQLDPLVDQKDQKAAIVYPIILPDRLDVIFKLPNQDLGHYRTIITQNQVENTVKNLREYLHDVTRTSQVKQQSQQLYDWLIRPVETELSKSGIKTLVFVLDGELRNIPMSVLYDKQQEKYLIEKYAISLTPGLQLLNPKPLRKVNLKVLTAGVSEGRTIENRKFPPLTNVLPELEHIQVVIPKTEQLFNQQFTANNLQNQLRSLPYSVVHLATHGEFSSDPEKTFILTWDRLLKVKEFDSLLRLNGETSSNNIELLVLSACKTAEGDKRAALGLAGIAIKAGARSTLATLWSVDDQSTADLMSEFYRELKAGLNKAEALQGGQLAVFAKEKRPYFWAPFVLVGNWL
jgi:CHAT domain-containing protein